MLSGKHVSQNVTPHRLMNGANRAQGEVPGAKCTVPFLATCASMFSSSNQG